MTGFTPCLTSPGNCPLATDGHHIRFHKWQRALNHACGRASGSQFRTGRRDRYRVFFDGTHWRVRNLVTGEED